MTPLLRRKADRRSLVFMAAWFVLVAVQWFYGSQSPWLAVPLLALSCALTFLVAVITHNTIHVPVFKSQSHERALKVVLSVIYGHPVSSFMPGHNLSHHQYTESPRDVIRTSKVRYRWNLLNLLFFFSTISSQVIRDELRFVRKARLVDRAWFRDFMLETIIWLMAVAVLVYFSWWKFVLCVALPNMYAAWGILTMNMLQHDGCDADDKYNHSRNFVGAVINWVTFNNGYHGVHHLNPGIHWSDLPARHAELLAPHIHPALEQPALHTYLFKTYVWPGQRLRYDGGKLELKPVVVDEDWIGELSGPFTAWPRRAERA